MGPVALDADVVIGFLDPADAHHERAVGALGERARAPKLMPTTTYAEVLVHAIREDREDEVERFLVRAGVELVPIDRALARRAAELRARFLPLSLADCSVLATAVDHPAELLSFDLQLGLAWDRLR